MGGAEVIMAAGGLVSRFRMVTVAEEGESIT